MTCVASFGRNEPCRARHNNAVPRFCCHPEQSVAESKDLLLVTSGAKAGSSPPVTRNRNIPVHQKSSGQGAFLPGGGQSKALLLTALYGPSQISFIVTRNTHRPAACITLLPSALSWFQTQRQASRTEGGICLPYLIKATSAACVRREKISTGCLNS